MGLLGEYTGFQDMFDGGGAGQSGPTFEGGPLSDALNTLGVRPHGYRRREDIAARGGVNPDRGRPVASPAPVRPVVNPVGPVNRDYGFSGVSGVNPVTAYDEAARFGLLAPEPNVAYVPEALPMSYGPGDIAAAQSYYADRFGASPLADEAFRTYLIPAAYR